MQEISIDNFTILLYLKNPTVFHWNNTIWYCCVYFIILNFYINNIFALKTSKWPYNQLGNNFLRSILGIFATRISNILGMSKPNITQYIKMVETLRRCQYIVISFPFFPCDSWKLPVLSGERGRISICKKTVMLFQCVLFLSVTEQ